MKRYFSVNGGDTFVEFDEETKESRTIIKSQLIAEKAEIEKTIGDYQLPTDEEILAWAKTQVPFRERIEHRELLDSQLLEINSILSQI